MFSHVTGFYSFPVWCALVTQSLSHSGECRVVTCKGPARRSPRDVNSSTWGNPFPGLHCCGYIWWHWTVFSLVHTWQANVNGCKRTNSSDVGLDVFTSVVKKSIIFWDITPCSPLSVCHLLGCWFIAELISSTLKMEAICSSYKSVGTQQTTWRYILEDDTLQIHQVFTVKGYTFDFAWVRRQSGTPKWMHVQVWTAIKEVHYRALL
jgi:hypothetical protein